MKTILVISLALLLSGCAWTKLNFEVDYPDGSRVVGSYWSNRDLKIRRSDPKHGTIEIEAMASTAIGAQATMLGAVAHEVAKGAVEGAKP